MKKTVRWPAPAACNLGSRRFFQGFWGFHVGLGREPADFHRLHSQRSQILPHLGRLMHNAGPFGNLGRRFRHGRRRMLLKVGFEHGTVVGQFTVWTIVIEALQWFDPARHVRLAIAMKTGVGNPTPPQNCGIGHVLTPPLEGFHPHLRPWVGMLKPPIPQRREVLFGEDAFEHRRVPRHSVNRQIIPRRGRLYHKASS